jgi:hypothetical protein
MRPVQREIPAFLAIDVEPDGFTTPNLGWGAFDDALVRIDRLRSALTEVSGHRPRFQWYLRMDPQIAEVHGRPDHLAVAYRDELDRLAGLGDAFGLHAHPLRRPAAGGEWFHDFGLDWLTHCLDVGFDAYVSSFGVIPERHRFGASHIEDALVDLLEQRGVLLDNTPEPGSRAWAEHPLYPIECGIDATPRTKPATDLSDLPRRPYRPSRRDFRRPGRGADARNLVILPLWATPLLPDRSLWSQAREALATRRMPPSQPMYPSVWDDEPGRFWDLVERDLALRARPYLALAIRTDVTGTLDEVRARAIISHLPRHRLARRLRFVDPLEAIGDLLPAAERQAPASTSLAQR